ncbi:MULTISPECIES: hypothetical protein [unclassified Bifidobacterium]|uniref:hypothetical protein n=1 Tax=unclassified Bifidobacterium TaxID=2608897 RepID=UPI002158C9E3|nr:MULTISPECIES: hypothetical protein [unclassified Bifidobacterium]
MKFIKGLSISQIVAGSLAAVTSFLLSAKIGVGGSVIGAAASYIISTVAANVYKNVLDVSGEKLQSITPGSSDDSDDVDKEQTPTSVPTSDTDATKTTDDDAAESDATTVIAGAAGAVRTPREVSSNVPSADRQGLPATRTSTYTLEEIRRTRKRRIDPKRMAIIVSVVSGLIGVAFAAGLVLLFTNGNGTDTVVRDVVHPTTSQTQTTENETDTNTTPTAPSQPKDHSGRDSGSTDSGDSDNGSTTDSNSMDSSDSTNGTTGSETDSNSGSSSGSTGSTGSNGSDSGSTGSGSNSSGTGSSGDSSSNGSGSSESGSNGSGSSGTTGSDSGTSGSTSGSAGSAGTGSSSGSSSGSTGSN